jgi:hypothetical protein
MNMTMSMRFSKNLRRGSSRDATLGAPNARAAQLYHLRQVALLARAGFVFRLTPHRTRPVVGTCPPQSARLTSGMDRYIEYTAR